MKPRIVFVDDEPNVLSALQDVLRGQRRAWDLAFYHDAGQALAAMWQTPADVVVSDMRMPGIDGATFLAHVKERWPHTIRILLSGHIDPDFAPEDVLVAHQALPKPCDPNILQGALSRVCELRKLLPNPELAVRAASLSALPPVARTYIGTVEATSLGRPVQEVGRLVEQDVALTAKVLQLTGSAFFGSPRAATSVRQAVAALGAEMLETVVLALGNFRALGGVALDEAVVESHNERARQVAKMAALIAPDPSLREAASLAGLLHDAGELVGMVTAGAPVAPHHAELGAYVLGIWGLPDAIVNAVAYHHRPSAQAQKTVTLADIVHFAEVLVADEQPGHERVPRDEARLRQLESAGQLARWRRVTPSPSMIRALDPARI